MRDLRSFFNEHEDEFLKFERIERPLHARPDIAAFLLLDELFPHAGRDMIGCAEHDQIWLDVDCDKLVEFATDEQLIDLHRCGVRYDSDTHSLAMFV